MILWFGKKKDKEKAKAAGAEMESPELSADELAAKQAAEAEAAEEAAAIYDRIEPVQGLNYANSLRIVALASEKLGKGEGARQAWSDARGVYVIHGVDEGVAECDAHLGTGS